MVGSPRRRRNLRDDGNCPVGRDRQDAVDIIGARGGFDGVDVREVDDLGDVGDAEAGRVGVPVDGDDAMAALARLDDRAPLVATCTDEEDASTRRDANRRGNRPWGTVGSRSARSRVTRARVVRLGYEPWGGGRWPENGAPRLGSIGQAGSRQCVVEAWSRQAIVEAVPEARTLR